MAKRTIEIDVPDGYEATDIFSKPKYRMHSGFDAMDVLVHLKQKEPEFIEVRCYLARDNPDGEFGIVSV